MQWRAALVVSNVNITLRVTRHDSDALNHALIHAFAAAATASHDSVQQWSTVVEKFSAVQVGSVWNHRAKRDRITCVCS
jgi:hypothetical protein